MEKQIGEVLIEILSDIPLDNDKNFLDSYYELFNAKKYFGKEFELIYEDMKNAYSLEKYFFNYDAVMINTYKKLVQCVINTADNKNRMKLIPLIIYLDIENILYKYLSEKKYFDGFVEEKEFFIGYLSDSNANIDTKHLSQYHWEMELVKDYQRGLEEKNFTKIYTFIESIDRGMGLKYDNFFDFLVFISYRIFFDDLSILLEKKQDMIGILYISHNLNIQETLSLAHHTNNLLLKFEAIKNAVYFKKNNQSCLNLLKDERDLIEKIILDFSKDEVIWKQFLYFYLEYPLRSPQLFLPLANVLSILGNDKIDTFIQAIKINQYFDDDSKEALNSCILKIENDEKREYILKHVFSRWEEFLDNYEGFFTSIIATDVIDIVITYAMTILSIETIKDEIEKIVFNIDEIDNRWFKTISEQNNYFYKQLSKLFVYGFCLDKYQLFDLKNSIIDILRKSSLLKREHVYKSKTTIQLFDEYVLKDQVV